MDLLKEKRFWAALGLGLALCALVSPGISIGRPGHESVWERQVLPWLQVSLVSGIIVLISLVTAIKYRPRRPERLAAWVGALLTGGILLTALGGRLNFAATIMQYLLGGRPWQEIVELLSHMIPSNWRFVISTTATFALTLGVICWLAANCWRIGSWEKFRRGPGGAILKGGIIAGLIVLPISISLNWYQHTVLHPQYIKQLSDAGKHFPHSISNFSWALLFISGGLHNIVSGAVITAILAPLRPKPGLGAFAGGGLVLGMAAFSLLLLRLSRPSFSVHPLHGEYVMQIFSLVLLGAIAGSFAGRWSEVEIAKTE